MSEFWSLVRQVLTPGSAKLRGQMSLLTAQERRLIHCLQILEDPAISQINNATDSAAEFSSKQ